MEAGFRSILGWIFQCARMSDELPFAILYLRVYFTNSAFPNKVISCFLVPPMGIDINHSERGVAFLGHFDFYGVPLIPNQVMAVKYVLPILSPTSPIEMP